MIKEINPIAQQKIEEYLSLGLGDKKVQTPYFINSKRRRDLRAMVGKGSPDEIVMEAKIWGKLKGVDLSILSEPEIKEFLISSGLGIDCSGFVVHVLDAWYFDQYGKHIFSELKLPSNGLMSALRFRLRPVENLGANTLTGNINTELIGIDDVLPGDVIRSKWKKVGTHHIQLVTKVEYVEVSKPVENGKRWKVSMIEYTHSTPYYGETSGVRTGQIRILDSKKPLYDQEWLEKDEHGVNFSYEGFLTQVEDNGLRRIKAMKDLILNNSESISSPSGEIK